MNKKRRASILKSNAPFSIFGFIGILYGLKCIFTQSMSWSDKYASDVTWQLTGDKAILLGIVILAFSIYFVYISFTTHEHN
jgi:hypothetical protein